MNKPKIMIAIPMLNTLCAEFFTSIMTIKTNGNTQIAVEVGSLVYEARNKLMLKALEKEADYILWLDSDMKFPPDILLKLLEDAEQGMEYVCVGFTSKDNSLLPRSLQSQSPGSRTRTRGLSPTVRNSIRTTQRMKSLRLREAVLAVY